MPAWGEHAPEEKDHVCVKHGHLCLDSRLLIPLGGKRSRPEEKRPYVTQTQSTKLL